jgi:translation elongation factor EF-1alpha
MSQVKEFEKIGTVSHYYNKIEVAVVELIDTLQVGEIVKFIRGGEDLFEQEIKSIELEHKSVMKADQGDSIGIRVKQKTREGTEVFRVT